MNRSTTLGEISDIITGPFGSQLHMSDYVEEGIPVIMPQDIVDGTVSLESIAHISNEDYNRLIRYAVTNNDIIFARRGDIEKHAFITDDSLLLCGTGCFRVRITDSSIYPLFLSYFLDRLETRKWLTTHAIGSNMPNLNTTILSSVPVELPDYEEQVKIGDFLYNIEKKIQCNKKINDNLQQQLKLLYDYWFTQFDFPDENGKPYRSSGGTMVWNEQLKREVPFDWQITGIKEITNITWGQCPDGKNILDKTAQGNNVLDYCSGAGDMKGGFLVDCQAKTDNSKRLAHKNDILVSVAGKIGDMCVVDHTISLGRAAMAYTVEDEKEITFVYLTLQALNRKMTTISTGSIQKVINSDHIDDFIFPYQKDIVLRFGELTQDIYFELIKLSHENRQLKKLRDWLLPMLMNGQATISD